MPDAPHVTILMATYNGAPNIGEQLASIEKQSHKNWSLIISDDGSTDNTLPILENFSLRSHDVAILDGPQKGAAANFMSLIERLPSHAPDDSWVAFCDQDDVWLPEKIKRAISLIQECESDGPVLYCSRTLVTDKDLGNQRLSVSRLKPLGFQNALVQNIASGNTILLNKQAARLLMVAAREAREVVVHDWWAYQMVSGAGGRLIHDDVPSLLYRQHEINQIGANDGFKARFRRAVSLMKGTHAKWNEINIAALQSSEHRLTEENRQILESFAKLRTLPFAKRMVQLFKLGLYRQTYASTVALWVAAALRRI